jgi:proline iminopeptidase
LLGLIQGGRDSAEVAKYCRAWARYEMILSSLLHSDEEIEKDLNSHDPRAFALLENYYMANHCFLGEGQLLRDAHKIRDIPTILVNGRYDMVCPPANAYRLHLALPSSMLIIAEGAGHWMGEKPIERALLKAMRQFE